MAAKSTPAAGKKPAAAKSAAAPTTPGGVEQSATSPGVGAPAGNAPNSAGSEDESADDKALREMALLEGEARVEDAERTEAARLLALKMTLLEEEALAEDARRTEAANLLAEQMAFLEGEAHAYDQARTESLETAQTGAEKAADCAVTLTVWALPEISEFPATIVLENHTRSRIPVAGAQIFLDPYAKAEVEVTADQFAKLAKALTSSARAHKWDNLKGLQVKYDRKN